MGLSSKQVSRDGVGWNQALLQADHQQLPKPPSMKRQQPTATNQQQQAVAEPPLKCPRCESTNTKFCYYNNYNKTQPRHFCKACKRHWTKGGTLRNVPVGGGRKNKRIKTSNTSSTITTTTTSGSNINNNNNNRINNNTHLGIQCHHQQQPIISRQNNLGNFVFGDDHDQKNLSEILYQAMIHQHHDHNYYSSPVVPSSSNFIGSSSNHESSLLFPYSSSTSFDTTTTTPPSSISNSINQSSNVYNYAGSETIIDDPSSSTGMISSTTQPWQVSTTTSTAMDTTTTSFCNWDDIIDTFVSSTQDLNIPNWVVDDSHDQTKP
ncbi:hypothetical protein Dsin_027600 [Dipteronia sinensis]|uniref:Dof zinc finger protein n=1 Tax=Dipteronia sinensis TaxID=43782 RepID=A0AAD9ZPH9_9ROSI|nr:hypothetical protein Dsin_027600 [Dipteronia sinensis]